MKKKLKILRHNGDDNDHERVERELGTFEKRLNEMAARLREVEITVGIFKPPVTK